MDSPLDDENTYKQLTSDPLKRWQQSYNRKLKSLLFRDNPELFKKFQSYLPSLPYMYGLPKIHKDGVPMRPITSTRNSVSYNLASWLAKHLSPALGILSQSHLKDTCDFVNKIRSMNFSNKKLVSFDVESLFTKVPVKECIEILKNRIDDFNLNLPIPSSTFVSLIEICISECYFVCNQRYFTQVDGLPMGSPLPPVFSNLFREYYESLLTNHSTF